MVTFLIILNLKSVHRLRSIVYYHNGESVPENVRYKDNPIFASFGSYRIQAADHRDVTNIETIFEIGTKLGKLRWRKFGPRFLDGWLYGNVDASGHFTGNDIAYIYADLTTVIYGTFDKGVLIKGRERKVKGFRYVSANFTVKDFSKALRVV